MWTAVRFLAAVVATLASASPAIRAQPAGLQTPPGAPAATAPAPLPPILAEPEVYADSTPRGALSNFLAAARRIDYQAAAAYLDLRLVPEQARATEGPALARRLKVILDRSIWFDLQTISDYPDGTADDGLPTDSERVATIRSDSGTFDVILRRSRQPNGNFVWRFSSAVVSRIPTLYEEFGYGWVGERVPDRLHRMWAWHLELWQVFALAVVLVLAWLLSWAAAFVVVGVVHPIFRRTRSKLDDQLLEVLRNPVRRVLAVAFLEAGVAALRLPRGAQLWVNRAVWTLAFLAVITLVVALVDAFAKTMRERIEAGGEPANAGIVTFVSRLLKGLLVAVAVIVILQAAGFNVTGLLAGLGLGGVALALAAQKTVENLLGGIALMIDKPVRLGDHCRFGTTEGWVEQLGLRSTRIRTMERSIVTVPNSVFSNMEIENLSARPRIRFLTKLPLRAETTADQLRAALEGIRTLLQDDARVSSEGKWVRLVGFAGAAFSVEVQALVMTTTFEEFIAIREELLLRILDILQVNGTGLAFPSQSVYYERGRSSGELPPRESGAAAEH